MSLLQLLLFLSLLFACDGVLARLWKAISTRNFNYIFEPKPHDIICYINGIYHSENDWNRIVLQLSNIFHCEVKPFYNPSSGYWAADAAQAGLDLISKPRDNVVAKQLAHHLKSLLSELSESGRILHLAHSGGAIVTYLAAKHYLTEQEKGKIDVLTFGAGHSITRKYFGGRLVNYYARNDPLAFVDRRAMALKSRSFSSLHSEEVYENKHNTSFVFLHGAAHNAILDHSLEGPTYHSVLEAEAKKLIERRRQILRRLTLRKRFRKKCAQLTGLHHFFDRPLLRLALETIDQNYTVSLHALFQNIPIFD